MDGEEIKKQQAAIREAFQRSIHEARMQAQLEAEKRQEMFDVQVANMNAMLQDAAGAADVGTAGAAMG